MWWKSIVGENDYSSQLGVHGSFPTLVALAFQPRIINQQLKKVSQLKPMIIWVWFSFSYNEKQKRAEIAVHCENQSWNVAMPIVVTKLVMTLNGFF